MYINDKFIVTSFNYPIKAISKMLANEILSNRLSMADKEKLWKDKTIFIIGKYETFKCIYEVSLYELYGDNTQGKKHFGKKYLLIYHEHTGSYVIVHTITYMLDNSYVKLDMKNRRLNNIDKFLDICT